MYFARMQQQSKNEALFQHTLFLIVVQHTPVLSLLRTVLQFLPLKLLRQLLNKISYISRTLETSKMISIKVLK